MIIGIVSGPIADIVLRHICNAWGTIHRCGRAVVGSGTLYSGTVKTSLTARYDLKLATAAISTCQHQHTQQHKTHLLHGVLPASECMPKRAACQGVF